MKKKGATLEFGGERAAAVVREWFESRAKMPQADIEAVAAAVVAKPASRFWVSEERAAAVVADVENGRRSLKGMRAGKRRMYEEICRRVAAERLRRPGACLRELVASVIYEPAPEYYMEPYTALDIVYRTLRA